MPKVKTTINGVMLNDERVGRFAINSIRGKTETQLYTLVATRVQSATDRGRNDVRNIAYRATKRIIRALEANGIALPSEAAKR